jgi:hypothetical protein
MSKTFENGRHLAETEERLKAAFEQHKEVSERRDAAAAAMSTACRKKTRLEGERQSLLTKFSAGMGGKLAQLEIEIQTTDQAIAENRAVLRNSQPEVMRLASAIATLRQEAESSLQAAVAPTRNLHLERFEQAALDLINSGKIVLAVDGVTSGHAPRQLAVTILHPTTGHDIGGQSGTVDIGEMFGRYDTISSLIRLTAAIASEGELAIAAE